MNSAILLGNNISEYIKREIQNKNIACIEYNKDSKASIYITSEGEKLVVDGNYNLIDFDIKKEYIEDFKSVKVEEGSWYKKLWATTKGLVTDGLGNLWNTLKEHPVASIAIVGGSIGALFAINAIPVVGQAATGAILAGLSLYGGYKAIESAINNLQEASDAEKHGNYVRVEQEYEEFGGDIFDTTLSACGTVAGVKMLYNGINNARLAKMLNITDDAIKVAESNKPNDKVIYITKEATKNLDDITDQEKLLISSYKIFGIDNNLTAEQVVNLYNKSGVHQEALKGWGQNGKQLIKHYQLKFSSDTPRSSSLEGRISSLNNPQLSFSSANIDEFSHSVKKLLKYIETNSTKSIITTRANGGNSLKISENNSVFTVSKTIIDSKRRQVTYSWIATPNPNQNMVLIDGLPQNNIDGVFIVSSEEGISTVFPCNFKFFLGSKPK